MKFLVILLSNVVLSANWHFLDGPTIGNTKERRYNSDSPNPHCRLNRIMTRNCAEGGALQHIKFYFFGPDCITKYKHFKYCSSYDPWISVHIENEVTQFTGYSDGADVYGFSLIDTEKTMYTLGNITGLEASDWEVVGGPILGFWSRGSGNHPYFRQFGLRLGDPCLPILAGWPVHMRPG